MSTHPARKKPGNRCYWKFTEFLGRSNLATATPAEIGDWKDKLLKGELSENKLSKKTVRHTYLTALRTFLKYGIASGKFKVNACADIRVAKDRIVQSAPEDGDRDLSDEHAYLILSEALRPSDDRTSPLFAAAKRWVPWICAYTGARVNEVTQVRKMDFWPETITQGEAWVMRITPDAGPVKGGKARDVVLHPHLIEQGFVDFVKAHKEPGPLFYDPVRPNGGSVMNPPQRKVGDKLARWVREIGMDDPDVDPNHGWRHRFKSTARRDDVEMNEEVREAMAGHATATVGRRYGKMPTGRKYKEVCKLPRYEVKPPTGDLPDTAAKRKRNADRVATAERAKARKSAAARTKRPAGVLGSARYQVDRGSKSFGIGRFRTLMAPESLHCQGLETELRLAPFVGTDRLLQRERSLEFAAPATLAMELAAEALELVPPRLLVTE